MTQNLPETARSIPAALGLRADAGQISKTAGYYVAFISLGLVLPVVLPLLNPPGEIVALVKPQFEVGRGQVGRRGVVKDPEKHRAVLTRLADVAAGLSLCVWGITASPLLGPMGNREFLMHLRTGSTTLDTSTLIARALGLSEALATT